MLYLRLAAAILLVLYYTFRVIALYFVSRDKQRYRTNASNWGRRMLKVFGVSLDIRGIENLNKDTTYIFASNHASLFDIPILFYGLKDFNFVIMYKQELEKVPIFGWSLKVSPFISVKRSDPRNAMASIEQTLSQMADKDCPIIFPEGTRSYDGKLSSFKRGAFMLASRSKNPIAPIAIIGSNDILKKGTLSVKTHSIVKIVLCPPVEQTGTNDRQGEKQLMEKVHSIIKVAIEQNG